MLWIVFTFLSAGLKVGAAVQSCLAAATDAGREGTYPRSLTGGAALRPVAQLNPQEGESGKRRVTPGRAVFTSPQTHTQLRAS